MNIWLHAYTAYLSSTYIRTYVSTYVRMYLVGTYVYTYIYEWHFPFYFYNTGSLVHTESPKGKKAYAFIDLYQFPHDANLTGNALLCILGKSSPLPPCLFLQFDNCFRENKNKYIFGLCALLVELQIVKKVSMYICAYVC